MRFDFCQHFSAKISKKVVRGEISMNCIRKREKYQTFFGETSKNAISIVARGPVPRDRPSCTKNGRSPELTAVFFHDRCLARDRPSPYGNGDGFLFLTVARGPVPRETLNRAEMVPFYRSAGACPPRSSELHEKWPQPRTHGHFLSRPMQCEGQALALR